MADTAVDEVIEPTPAWRWAGAGLYGLVGAVLLAAMAFEGVVAERTTSLAELMGGAVTVASSPREAAAQLEWRAASTMLVGALAVALVVAGASLARAWRVDRRATVTLVTLPPVVGLAVLAVVARSETSVLTDVARLVAGADASLSDAVAVALWPKRIGEVAAGVVGVGLAASIVLPRRVTLTDLRAASRMLGAMLAASALVLVVGVVLTREAYEWLFAHVSAPDDVLTSAEIEALVDAGTRLAASFYTIILVVAYVPAAGALALWARRLADRRTAADTPAETWLAERGVETTWGVRLARLGALLAPMLSAVVPEVAHVVGLG